MSKFIKIGNQIINLHLVTHVKLDAKIWDKEQKEIPSIRVHFAAPSAFEYLSGSTDTHSYSLDFTGMDAEIFRWWVLGQALEPLDLYKS